MNYFDMMPDDIQELILDFKSKKEEKTRRLKRMKIDMNNACEQVNSMMATFEDMDHQDPEYYKYFNKLDVALWVQSITIAKVELELQYEDPKKELGLTGYEEAMPVFESTWSDDSDYDDDFE